MPGELHTLLERCQAGEAPAWERFAAWVKARGRAILGGVGKLSEADGEDAVAEALKGLVTVWTVPRSSSPPGPPKTAICSSPS